MYEALHSPQLFCSALRERAVQASLQTRHGREVRTRGWCMQAVRQWLQQTASEVLLRGVQVEMESMPRVLHRCADSRQPRQMLALRQTRSRERTVPQPQQEALEIWRYPGPLTDPAALQGMPHGGERAARQAAVLPAALPQPVLLPLSHSRARQTQCTPNTSADRHACLGRSSCNSRVLHRLSARSARGSRAPVERQTGQRSARAREPAIPRAFGQSTEAQPLRRLTPTIFASPRSAGAFTYSARNTRRGTETPCDRVSSPGGSMRATRLFDTDDHDWALSPWHTRLL